LVGSSIAAWLVLASSHEPARVRTAALVVGVAWSFLAAGVVALARSPGRFGALMCAVGLAVPFAALGAADASVPFTAGLVAGSVWVGILVHAIVAFPSGRLPSRAAVAIVAAGYAVVTVGQLLVLLFDDLAGECPECPANAVLVRADDGVSAVMDAVVGIVGALVAAAVVVELARRWRSASPPLRRALAPVVATGGAAIAALALLYATTAVAPGGAEEAASWLALALLVAIPFAFLIGLLRMRLARAAVGRLVVELGATPAGDELRGALRRAMHDPGLAVAYWRPDARRFVDGDGAPVELPGEGEDRAASLVERGGEPVAALIHDASVQHDPELVEAVVATAALALENERLQAALRARLEELRASRARLVEAQADERRLLERDLHDGAQQRLVALALELKLAEARAGRDPSRSVDAFAHARDQLLQAIDELREIAHGIHPALLSARGLGAALEALAARTPLPVAVEADLPGRLPETVEIAAYYVAAEALTNVVKYAEATHVSVRLARDAGQAVLEIEDDGAGGADPARGSGLRGLADRVEALDGRLEVVSPPGRGTVVRAAFPLHRGAARVSDGSPSAPSARTARADSAPGATGRAPGTRSPR
jgi:signal transduction histidine kinase